MMYLWTVVHTIPVTWAGGKAGGGGPAAFSFAWSGHLLLVPAAVSPNHAELQVTEEAVLLPAKAGFENHHRLPRLRSYMAHSRWHIACMLLYVDVRTSAYVYASMGMWHAVRLQSTADSEHSPGQQHVHTYMVCHIAANQRIWCGTPTNNNLTR
jgi:hypothetical protein